MGCFLLGLMATIRSEFGMRDTKIIGHSIDSVDEHFRWMKDIEETQGMAVNFPIIGDETLRIAKLYEMLPESAIPGARTAGDNATVRLVFVVGPDKKIKMMSSYPMTVGRNFDEVLRVIDSLQLTEQFGVATPVNWVPGGDVVIPLSIGDAEAEKRFPCGWKSDKPYLRTMRQPGLDCGDDASIRETENGDPGDIR